MSILQVIPFDEEFKDEHEEEVASIIVEKIKKDVMEGSKISFQTANDFDPTTLCLLAVRPKWVASNRTSGLLMALFASIISLSYLLIAAFLYFGRFPPGSDWWEELKVLQRGATAHHPLSQSLLRNLCMALHCCYHVPHVVKVIHNLQLQVFCLEPLSFDHHALPILCATGLILDLISLFSMLLAGLVYISEVNGSGIVAELLQSLVLTTLLSTYRKHLSYCAMTLISIVLYDPMLVHNANKFLTAYKSTEAESLLLLSSSTRRARHILVFLIVFLLVLAFLTYELNCPGYLENCVYDFSSF